MRATNPMAAPLTLRTAKRVSGLTHTFYRYPATTSPELIRQLILQFSKAGDTVLDPFMGGGTTVVEALANGRRAIGMDVNPLAISVARAKTTPISSSQWGDLEQWASTGRMPRCRSVVESDPRVANLPPRLRMWLEERLLSLAELIGDERLMARCSLLRVAQWALETRDDAPCARALNARLRESIVKMRHGMTALVSAARENGITKYEVRERRRLVRLSAEAATQLSGSVAAAERPSLVVTSPPYPGVHVLYHRWQINGRRETPAPYWIAGQRDGHGSAFYTLGGRSRAGQTAYFERLQAAYASLRTLLAEDAIVTQLVAFNDSFTQGPLFLAAMRAAGYESISGVSAQALARDVPNRRWYARGKQHDAGKEYLLIHQVRSGRM